MRSTASGWKCRANGSPASASTVQRLELFETRARRIACLKRNHLPIGPHALLGVNAPADAGAGAGNRLVRFRVDKHPLGANQAAMYPGLFNLTNRFGDHQAAPFAACKMARFTATRAS